MSEWEDFCESNGWNAGVESDYDKFLDSLEGEDELIFHSFQEASQWSMKNNGAPFTRSPDGKSFIPKESKK